MAYSIPLPSSSASFGEKMDRYKDELSKLMLGSKKLTVGHIGDSTVQGIPYEKYPNDFIYGYMASFKRHITEFTKDQAALTRHVINSNQGPEVVVIIFGGNDIAFIGQDPPHDEEIAQEIVKVATRLYKHKIMPIAVPIFYRTETRYNETNVTPMDFWRRSKKINEATRHHIFKNTGMNLSLNEQAYQMSHDRVHLGPRGYEDFILQIVEFIKTKLPIFRQKHNIENIENLRSIRYLTRPRLMDLPRESLTLRHQALRYNDKTASRSTQTDLICNTSNIWARFSCKEIQVNPNNTDQSIQTEPQEQQVAQEQRPDNQKIRETIYYLNQAMNVLTQQLNTVTPTNVLVPDPSNQVSTRVVELMNIIIALTMVNENGSY